jgi:dihydrofolate synthase/folylpolyglutamate synthase
MEMRSDLWEWLGEAQHRGVHPGLERMHRLLRALGNPENKLRCLHVAGTNGKGSVCAFAESILRAGGYRTGFYSSPHLVDFTERIRIAGEPVSIHAVEEGIARLQQVTASWKGEDLPTYFELVTALAFDLFARADCEVVVLETGLGGRLDATNVAPKIACAITPIALDHREWLGDSLSEIAREKAGIMRPHLPVVIAPQEEEAAEALAESAKQLEAPCCWITEPLSKDDRIGLSGSHQRWNAALALGLLKAGGFHLDHEIVNLGLSLVSWPGRFQRLRGGRLVLDGAHNLHAAQHLVQTWREEFGTQRCQLIFGALADKDPKAMLTVLESIAETVFLVPVASPRSLNPKQYGGDEESRYHLCTSLREGLDLALGESEYNHGISRSPVLLTGSLFLVGEALSLEQGRGFHARSQ